MAGSVWAVRDELWEVFRELLPPREPQRTGRPRVDDRVAFNAVVYVLVTGIAWRHLPPELGCSRRPRIGAFRTGSAWGLAATAPRAGLPPQRGRAVGLVDRVIDGSHVRALQGGA